MMGPADRVRALQADRNNQQIEAKRQTVISTLVAITKPFLIALEKYAAARHKNKSFELSDDEMNSLKIEAIKQLERRHLSIEPEILEGINLENLSKVSPENNRRLAYIMAHAILVSYEKKVKSYPIGYETNSETLVDIAKAYFWEFRTICIEHSAFNAGRSTELKDMLIDSIRRTPFPSITAQVMKALSEMYTLLEAPAGRFDTFTLLRTAISSQYQFELAKFIRVHSKEKQITALPAAIIEFIISHPSESSEIIIDRLAHAICKNPDLATDFELNAVHLEMQVEQAMARNAASTLPAAPSRATTLSLAQEQVVSPAGASAPAATPIASAVKSPVGSPRYIRGIGGMPIMTAEGRAAAEALMAQQRSYEPAAGGAGRESDAPAPGSS